MRFQDRIREAFDHFRSIPKALENLADAIRSTQKSDPTENERYVRAEIRFTEAEITQRKTDQKEQTSIQLSIRNAAWCAFGAASFYAGVAILQWCETQHQSIIQKNANMTEKRAWLATSILEIKKPGLRQISFGMQIDNTGVTPAKRVFTEVQVRLSWPKQKLNFHRPPAWPTTKHVQNLIRAKDAPKFDADLPGISPTGDSEPVTLPAAVWDEFEAGKRVVVVFGTTTYMDVFGFWHWYRFCEWISGGSIEAGPPDCIDYSGMDKTDLDDKGKDPHEPRGMPYIGPNGIEDIRETPP